jgi:catechol 2,3-dioxygenase-like lactoylglutathione lyase family enzyme
MATAKKARAKAVSKTTKKTPAKKRVLAKKRPLAKKTALAKKAAPAVTTAPARELKARRVPETLRLTGFTPSLTVNDLSRSMAFYTDGLGFIVGERWSDGDVLRGVMLRAGACELGLSQDDWKQGRDRQKGAGFRIWCDTVQDLDAIAARLKAKGSVLTEEPEDHPAWGVRSFSVDDPDGFHLTIARKL